jgi:hypothetical protein
MALEYLGGWKAGEYAIYSESDIGSLFVVQIQPLSEKHVLIDLYHIPVDIRMKLVRAMVIDTSLIRWDVPVGNRQPVPPSKSEGTTHYYDYRNLYWTFKDLVDHMSRMLHWDALYNLITNIEYEPGYQKLKVLGLLPRSYGHNLARQQSPWHQTLRALDRAAPNS